MACRVDVQVARRSGGGWLVYVERDGERHTFARPAVHSVAVRKARRFKRLFEALGLDSRVVEYPRSRPVR